MISEVHSLLTLGTLGGYHEALPAPKVDQAKARSRERAQLRRQRQRARLDHDVAHVERALPDEHVVQAEQEREAFRPVRPDVDVSITLSYQARRNE